MMQLRTSQADADQIYPYIVSWLLVQKALNDNVYAQKRHPEVGQQAYLKSVIKDFPKPCYLKTLQSGEASIYSNTLFKEIFVTDEEYAARIQENTSASASTDFQQVFEQIASLEDVALSNKQDVIEKVLPVFIDASGKIVMLVVCMTVIVEEDDGSVTGLFCRFNDLTEVMSSKRLLSLYFEQYKSKRLAIKHFLEHIGFADELQDPKTAISKRELDCLIKLAEGMTAKETARELFISHRTVEAHIENAKFKLGIKKKHELLSLFKTYFK